MSITGIHATTPVLVNRQVSSPGRTGMAGFGAALAAASAEATTPAVQSITAKDGTVWTVTDIGASLTDDDKRILGWPTTDPATGMLAAMIAQDRNQGILNGPITADDIVGNPARGIAGFADRQPDLASGRIDAMLDRLDRAGTDFTDMTRKELFDWMNGKIASGEMSLDDSFAFLAMTVKIPVGGGQGAQLALDDTERVDFVHIAQDGIAGALERNDQTTRKMLETAMRAMRHDQRGDIDRFA